MPAFSAPLRWWSLMQCPLGPSSCKLRFASVPVFLEKITEVFQLKKKHCLNHSQVACWTMFEKKQPSPLAVAENCHLHGWRYKILARLRTLSPSQPDHQANLRAGTHPYSRWGQLRLAWLASQKKYPGETIVSICFPALGMIWISSVLYGLMDGLKFLEISQKWWPHRLRLRLLLGLHGRFIEDDHHPRRSGFESECTIFRRIVGVL